MSFDYPKLCRLHFASGASPTSSKRILILLLVFGLGIGPLVELLLGREQTCSPECRYFSLAISVS